MLVTVCVHTSVILTIILSVTICVFSCYIVISAGRQHLVCVKILAKVTVFSIFMFVQFCLLFSVCKNNSNLIYFPGSCVLCNYNFSGFYFSSWQQPHPPGDIHYAVVLDAGSSGTRTYLFSWPDHCGDKHELLKISPLLQGGEPMVKKATPGLSSLGETPDNAFEYIRPLLMFASNTIPKEKHKETSLYILATAGMRLLEKNPQEALLANLRMGINENFAFYFPTGHLEIISGKQEGI